MIQKLMFNLLSTSLYIPTLWVRGLAQTTFRHHGLAHQSDVRSISQADRSTSFAEVTSSRVADAQSILIRDSGILERRAGSKIVFGTFLPNDDQHIQLMKALLNTWGSDQFANGRLFAVGDADFNQ